MVDVAVLLFAALIGYLVYGIVGALLFAVVVAVLFAIADGRFRR